MILNKLIQSARKLLNVVLNFIINAFEIDLIVNYHFIQLRLNDEFRVQIHKRVLKMLKQLVRNLDHVLFVYNRLNAQKV